LKINRLRASLDENSACMPGFFSALGPTNAEDADMHARRIVHRFIECQLRALHAARRRLLRELVVAVIAGSFLSQSHLARGLASSACTKQAIKRVGRFIDNPRLAQEACQVGEALIAVLSGMSRCLVIAVDWSSASPGGKFVELRAAVTWPGAGRSLPVYQRLYPMAQLSDPAAEFELLDTLRSWISSSVKVIVITDAGFRRPWFRHVERLGWSWIGRIRRGASLYSPHQGWQSVADWFERATSLAVRTSDCQLTRRWKFSCDVVLYRQRPKGRRQCGSQGRPTKHKAAREARQSGREPWLLAHSPSLTQSHRPDEIVALYSRRMQIEENFRDSKSPVFGMGFSVGRARAENRLHGLLLIGVVAAFVMWHIGQLAETEGLHRRFRLTTRVARELSHLSLARLLCTSGPIALSREAIRTLGQRLWMRAA